jgi:ParB family chromosome partitioning protein
MMAEKRGLGRGLSALLEEVSEAQTEAAGPAGRGNSLPIELIHRNPEQPRRHFGEDEIETLAASIREKGVLQPILVRPSPTKAGEYQIVAGERRWRAAQKAGLTEMPVAIRDFDDGETLEIAILENVQRADLNPLEEALGYRALMDRFSRTQDAVAQAIGKSRSHVANTLRLLALPDPVQTWLAEGKLTAGHARAIAAAADPLALARQVIDGDLNVRQAEALAKAEGGTTGKTSKSAPSKDADTVALERRLSEVLGLTVAIEDKAGRGELKIRYTTLEQLEAVCKKLGA